MSIELEIPFHDTDLLGVVWHGHYFKYFEAARTALLRSLDLEVHQVRSLGHRFYIIESHCRHAYPLRYGEQAQVTAWLRDVEHRIKVAYEIQNLTAGRRSARGHTVLITTDAEGNLLLETPDAIRHRLSPR